MKTALVTGVTGQDGSYLAELLIAKGYRVVGAVRDVQLAVESLPSTLVSRVELVVWDVLDQRRMVDVLSRYRPQEVYNFAAYSSGAGMYDDPVAIGEVNGLAVARTLEAVREVDAEGFSVSCGDGALRVLELQQEGRPVMDAAAFMRGNPIEPGDRFRASLEAQ